MSDLDDRIEITLADGTKLWSSWKEWQQLQAYDEALRRPDIKYSPYGNLINLNGTSYLNEAGMREFDQAIKREAHKRSVELAKKEGFITPPFGFDYDGEQVTNVQVINPQVPAYEVHDPAKDATDSFRTLTKEQVLEEFGHLLSDEELGFLNINPRRGYLSPNGNFINP